MKRSLWCLVLAGMIIGMSGCSSKTKTPSGILPAEKMQAILWDMIQADRFASSYIIKDTTKQLKTESLRLYGEVFQLHKITKEQFLKSYQYYLSRPDVTKTMFDTLTARANRMREEGYKPSK